MAKTQSSNQKEILQIHYTKLKCARPLGGAVAKCSGLWGQYLYKNMSRILRTKLEKLCFSFVCFLNTWLQSFTILWKSSMFTLPMSASWRPLRLSPFPCGQALIFFNVKLRYFPVVVVLGFCVGCFVFLSCYRGLYVCAFAFFHWLRQFAVAFVCVFDFATFCIHSISCLQGICLPVSNHNNRIQV